MKQKAASLLIALALVAGPLTVAAAGQQGHTVDEIRARAAEAQTKGREVVVRVRRGAQILVGPKDLSFEFLESANLRGRVTELREKDFTFVETDEHKGEARAVVSYADVLSIKHESGLRKALRNVGRYSRGVIELPAGLTVYGVLALLGRLPDC